MPEPLPSPAQAADCLIEAASGFYQRQWMAGTSGNLSLRLASDTHHPLRYLITASGRDKGALTPADFVTVAEGGTVLEPPGAKSSAETLLHEAVYRLFPQVNAVYHVHTVAATVLSRHCVDPDGVLRISGLEMLKGLGATTHDTTIELPVFDNSQDIQALSEQLPRRLRPDVPGFLLAGHGIYTWGESPFEARRHVEIWDFLFQCRLTELMLPVNASLAMQAR